MSFLKQKKRKQGPALQQLVTGETDGNDDSTVSGVILTEPGVNVQAQVDAATDQVVSEPREVESEETQQGTERPVIPWPTTDATPASEFNTPYFFSNSLLVSLWKGRFPHQPSNCTSRVGGALALVSRRTVCALIVWKFIVHNMIMRKRAMEQSRYFVDQQLGDPHITFADLQERLVRGNTSITNKLLYFGANLRGTAQY